MLFVYCLNLINYYFFCAHADYDILILRFIDGCSFHSSLYCSVVNDCLLMILLYVELFFLNDERNILRVYCLLSILTSTTGIFFVDHLYTPFIISFYSLCGKWTVGNYAIDTSGGFFFFPFLYVQTEWIARK